MRCFEIAENEPFTLFPFNILRKICKPPEVSVELSTTFCPSCYTAIGTHEKVAVVRGRLHHEACGEKEKAKK